MNAFNLFLAAALLSGGTALAQTTPGTTSTTSGPISGSGATTSGTAPASVGPALPVSSEYQQQQRNNQETASRKHAGKMKMRSSDGKKSKHTL